MKTRFILSALAVLLAVPASAQQGTFVRRSALPDGSGVIAVAATSQQVFPAFPERSYLFCQNPITATEPLFVNMAGPASTAGGSYELAPGGTLTMTVPFVYVGSVNVTAATVGHRFVCKAG